MKHRGKHKREGVNTSEVHGVGANVRNLSDKHNTDNGEEQHKNSSFRKSKVVVCKYFSLANYLGDSRCLVDNLTI